MEDRPRYISILLQIFIHSTNSIADYIFVLDPPQRELKITGVLEPPHEADFGEGLPQKGLCASDHISLLATMTWTDKSETSAK